MTTGREITVNDRTPIVLTPSEVVAGATTQAKLLMDIVEKTKCYQVIRNERYLQVEAWETIGAFNRVHAVTKSITPIIRDNEVVGYDAHVELINADGVVVGGAVMPCYFTENACKGKEGDAKDKAAKSAAQTFATSKAYRMNYSYIAILAGYNPTPAEEMVGAEITHDEVGHFCKIHNTPFFKKGKMPNYAHPLDGGGWCNEGEPEAPKTSPVSKDTTPVEKTPPDANPKGGKRDPATIKTIEQLAKALKADFGLSYQQQWNELNIKAWTDLTVSPAEAYIKVASTR